MAIFTKESLETLRNRIDLVEVLNQFVDLKRSGAAFKALCPFHDEKTPSFVVQRGDTHYHCFGCGAHGDAIAFLMHHQRLSFVDAVEHLADKFQVPLEKTDSVKVQGPSQKQMREALEFSCRLYHNLLLYAEEARGALRYLLQRGITIDFIKRFDIGYAPLNKQILKPLLQEKKIDEDVAQACGLVMRDKDFFTDRILFPIRAPSGYVIGFSGRKYKEETFGGKYVNTPETSLFKKSRVLFGLHESRQRIVKERKVLVVEGQIDALRLIYSGIDFVVAGQGTAFGQEHVQELGVLGVLTAYLAFDPDKAGMKAAFKVGDLFQKEGIAVKILRLPSRYDPDLFIKEKGKDPFLKLLEEAEDYLSFAIRYHSETIDLNSPAGKNEIVNLIKQQIKGWRQPLMVHESLKNLAHQLQVPEDLIGIGEIEPYHFAFKKSAFVNHHEVDPDWVLETDLLRALLKAQSSNSLIQDLAVHHLKEETFRIPVCQALFSLYLDTLKKQKPLALLDLVCALEEGEGQKLLEELLQKKLEEDKLDHFFTEALKKVLDREWMIQREAIRIKIQSGTYNDEEALELAKQFEAIKRTPPQLSCQMYG